MGFYADRVKDTTTSTGTGSITVSGAAPTGFRSFNSAFGTNVRFYYSIVAIDGNGAPTGEWEVGEGYLSASTTLVRDDILSSSNAGAAVNFGAGTKSVFCTIPASEIPDKSVLTARSFNLGLGY